MATRRKKYLNSIGSYLDLHLEDRETAAIVKEAELMYAPAEYLHQFFYSKFNKPFEKRKNELDAEGEKRLLDRNDPFVEMVLAQYCFYPETLTALYRRARRKANNNALEIACLANRSACAFTGIGFNDELSEILFPNEKKRREWLQGLSKDKLIALFSNPTIDEIFIHAFVSPGGYWRSLHPHALFNALIGLAKNERVTHKEGAPYGLSFSDQIRDKIFRMADYLPVTRDHAEVLRDLLKTVYESKPGTYGYDMNNAERWLDFSTKTRSRSENLELFTDEYFLLRFEIYRGFLRDHYTAQGELDNSKSFQHEDHARRFAAYQKLTITTKDIEIAIQSARFIAVTYLGRNESLFRDKVLRKHLRECCRELGAIDKFFTAYDNHRFAHPDWFDDDDPAEDDFAYLEGLPRRIAERS